MIVIVYLMQCFYQFQVKRHYSDHFIYKKLNQTDNINYIMNVFTAITNTWIALRSHGTTNRYGHLQLIESLLIDDRTNYFILHKMRRD